MKESLVSINIIKDENILLNPNSVPILLYWNNNVYNSIDEEIFFNEKSNKYIIKKCCNLENYTSSKLSYFYFKDVDNDGDEDYIEYNIDIQKLFKLSVLNENDRLFYKEYINECFNYLYFCSYKTEYIMSNNPLVWEENIIDIYKKIQEKHPNKILKNTVINYVRSELNQKYNLCLENSEWIISNLENILRNEK